MLRIPYESKDAIALDQRIFESIYHGALRSSNDLAKRDGPYETFKGSPSSEGILQFDMWGKDKLVTEQTYDWDSLKKSIVEYGLRNSLLLAPMPTASTSQILGNNESFEPYTSNIYTRRVLAGEFVCVNPHLIRELIDRVKRILKFNVSNSLGQDLWTPQIKNKLLAHNGSIQGIAELPTDVKELYKTTWEISQKSVIDHAAARGIYIDQSQSLNVHLSEANYSKMASMHFYAWRAGLKTGMYYLRTRPAADAIKFTVDVEMLLKDGGQIEIKNNNAIKNVSNIDKENQNEEDELAASKKKVKTDKPKAMVCSLKGDDGECMSCGS